MSKSKLSHPVPSDVPVHCAYDELADVVSLVPHPRNPNHHPTEQIALLARVIQHQGWRAPIVVSKLSGFVISGHGRLEAAKLLGLEKVPVNRQHFSTEADELAHLVADNRLAELSEIHKDELAELLTELEENLSLEVAGFDAAAWQNLQAEMALPEFKQFDENIDTSGKESTTKKSHTCPSCGHTYNA